MPDLHKMTLWANLPYEEKLCDLYTLKPCFYKLVASTLYEIGDCITKYGTSQKKKWQQWKAMIKMNKSKVSVPELTHAGSHDFTRALFLNTHVHFALCMPWHNTNAYCLKSLISDSSVFCAGNCSVAVVLAKRSPLTQTQWFSYGEKTFYYLLTIMPQHLNVQSICLWIRLG